MRIFDKANVVDDELHDLKLRFELLGKKNTYLSSKGVGWWRERGGTGIFGLISTNNFVEGDRKAYYETSQWAIRQNKEEIGQLRGQNRSLSEAIAKLKKVQKLLTY